MPRRHGDPCVDCGGGVSVAGVTRCDPCARARGARRLDEFAFLLDAGCSVAEALQRLDWTPGAAQRQAYRARRYDLSRILQPEIREAARGRRTAA